MMIGFIEKCKHEFEQINHSDAVFIMVSPEFNKRLLREVESNFPLTKDDTMDKKPYNTVFGLIIVVDHAIKDYLFRFIGSNDLEGSEGMKYKHEFLIKEVS